MPAYTDGISQKEKDEMWNELIRRQAQKDQSEASKELMPDYRAIYDHHSAKATQEIEEATKKVEAAEKMVKEAQETGGAQIVIGQAKWKALEARQELDTKRRREEAKKNRMQLFIDILEGDLLPPSPTTTYGWD